ncbi:MAG: toxin-antitoxin system YwqK family antitoxin [Paludibacteraceae bacterium]|nr:toxin-antitoxin system YwqK family antitoxin [Paludibacteraceae bacterium]MBP6284095.1 toxin-antitoxin system YwqK family antitoxin [Paludibacteraceae bacterium]
MKRIIILCMLTILSISAIAQTKKSTIIVSEGIYFTDTSQKKLFSGDYREYYTNMALKLEMRITNGAPDGAYVVYFANGKPQEVRSYSKGKLHGTWRTYNESALLIAEAQYLNNQKNGKWKIWDDNGTLRYEMNYTNGKKTGIWYMWDEKGKLISKKDYK